MIVPTSCYVSRLGRFLEFLPFISTYPLLSATTPGILCLLALGIELEF
jgi:hypothetical protein